MTRDPSPPIRFRRATHPPPILGLVVTLALVLAWTPIYAASTPPFFNDITSTAGIGVRCDCGFGDCGSGVAFADFDGDGDLDLFVGMDTGAANRLFVNDGFGSFTNRAGAAGVNDLSCAKGVAFADYDNDGDLDFFVASWDGPNVLYQNNGDATFTDQTVFARVEYTGKSSGATWGDFDNDGHLDLYIANDFGTGNVLYRNNGNETFTDVSLASGTNLSMLAMGIAIADYDHNGYLDLYITNAPVGNALLHNNGDGTFTDVAKSKGVFVQRNGWGTVFFDCDNDGDDDLYVVNQTAAGGTQDSENMLFENVGGTFADISASSGVADQRPGYGMAVGDYNNDGYYDMFVQNCSSSGNPAPMSFYENTTSGNNWVKFQTVGTQSNRDGIGARLTVTTGSLTQIKEVSGGSSYLSQNSLEVGFGIGEATSLDVLNVRWPSGIVDVYQNLPINQTRTLTEGETVPVFITGFDAAARGAGVELSWEIWRDEAIDGFRLYRSQAGGPAAELPIDGGLGPQARRYVDTAVEGGTRYAYVLAVVMPDGTELRSQRIAVELPLGGLVLHQNNPNPFNPLTRIGFVLPRAAPARLGIYDASGRLVTTLVDGALDAGPHEVTWSGRDRAGNPVASGIYFYRLSSGSRTLTRKMILLK